MTIWPGALRHPALPGRLKPLVDAHQRSGEVLIAWAQLVVVGTFGALYFLSAKTAPPESFKPVPWVLGAYLVLTLWRLWMVRRGYFPTAAAVLGIFLDVALLYALIWSFHLQYMQPATFYLKAPTLLYIFIFIALRALRFDARYILLIGLVAAAGWLGMLAYAIDGNMHIITRDYVEYLTTHRILLGGEFDKIVAILAVTAILAVAIARAQRVMISSVRESSVARDLSRFVPLPVAQRVAEAAEAPSIGQAERREATVLFIDVQDFTGLGESMSPEQLITTLNAYFAVVVKPIEALGGTVDQFIGDAVMATFNLPAALEDHAAAAVGAALEIQHALAHRRFDDGLRLHARVGINTGTVVGGLVGAADRLAYTVYGDTVNVAARLEPLNKQYGSQILVSERTRELAGPDRFHFRPVGEVQIRGRRGLTGVYAVDPPADRMSAA